MYDNYISYIVKKEYVEETLMLQLTGIFMSDGA